ncbi:MAG: polyphosphate polymerase domain-containing protein [Desulfovibrio sp.]|nr:polyphosphate polymerase domain-containing protein [Desulfovibrio sp.]
MNALPLPSTHPRYRHEAKYLCTSGMLEVIEHRLRPLMQLDSHSRDGDYTVSSLYFDDYRDSCCADNEAGIGVRHKYRVRVYNDDAGYMRLEKKAKCNGLCRKTSSPLDACAYRSMYAGDGIGLIRHSDHPLLKEFGAMICSRLYRPKIIVRYTRKAFVYIQGDVRVTLDRNITVSTQTECFPSEHEKMLSFPALDRGLHLLELKHTDILPYYIYQTIQMNTLQRVTFSKYYIGRKAARQFGGGIA